MIAPRCRLCQSSDIVPVPFEVPAERGRWWVCRACESHTSENVYETVVATYHDRPAYDRKIGWTSVEQFRDGCRWNCQWIHDHAFVSCGQDVLEIGTWHGAALDVMRELGWKTHGFDVVPVPFDHHPVTVKPFFHRWWWSMRFSAVLAIEVFEHVPNPEMFLHEVHGVLVPRGLFELTTPVPQLVYHDAPYQTEHLFLASPGRLKQLLNEAMFDVVVEKKWDTSQAYLCRAR